MNKHKLIFVFLLILCIGSTLISCTIVPHRFEWEIESIRRDVIYINGSTLSTESRQGVGEYNIHGIHSEMTYIQFFEDGTLIFKPIEEEKMTGTYKCKNNGIQDTSIYITLENGERLEARGVGSFYSDELTFEYHNVKYEFSDGISDIDRCENQEEYQEQLRELAKNARYWEENPRYARFKPCTVVIDENGGAILISDGDEIDLYSQNLGVTAIRITDNNEVIYLDEIKEGECYFYGDPSTPSIIVLFYLDPLPKNEEENPKPYSILELIPELEAFYGEDMCKDLSIKFSHELVNVSPGQYHSHKYITEQSEIEAILMALKNMELWEDESPSENDLNNPYGIDHIRIFDTTGTLSEIVISSYYDRIKIGDKWYYHGGAFPKFVFDGSFRTFVCTNYAAGLYAKDVFMGYTNILASLEYIDDPCQDYTYSTLHDTRTLVCDLGEITVYDDTHFRWKGQFYLAVGETDFSELYQ